LTVKRGKPNWVFQCSVNRTLGGTIATTDVAPVFLPEHFCLRDLSVDSYIRDS